MPTAHLSTDHLLALHAALIEEFGGMPGLRDVGALESAAARGELSAEALAVWFRQRIERLDDAPGSS